MADNNQPTATIDGVVRALCPGCRKPFAPGSKMAEDDEGVWWHENPCAIEAMQDDPSGLDELE